MATGGILSRVSRHDLAVGQDAGGFPTEYYVGTSPWVHGGAEARCRRATFLVGMPGGGKSTLEEGVKGRVLSMNVAFKFRWPEDAADCDVGVWPT